VLGASVGLAALAVYQKPCMALHSAPHYMAALHGATDRWPADGKAHAQSGMGSASAGATLAPLVSAGHAP
jgi:hypothetical protein